MQVNQDFLDDCPLVDEADNLHLAVAVFTDQRVDFQDLLNTFPPHQRRYSSLFVWADIDYLFICCLVRALSSQTLFLLFPKHSVWLEAVIPDELKWLLQYRLGNGSYKFQRVEGLKILFVFSMTYLRTKQHCFRLLDILDLRVRKCVADDILRQAFYPLIILWLYPYLMMNVKTGVVTPFYDHLDECIIDQLILKIGSIYNFKV